MAEAVELKQGLVGRKIVRTAVKQKTWRGEEGTMMDLEMVEVLRVKKVNYFIEVVAVVLEGKCKQSVVS